MILCSTGLKDLILWTRRCLQLKDSLNNSTNLNSSQKNSQVSSSKDLLIENKLTPQLINNQCNLKRCKPNSILTASVLESKQKNRRLKRLLKKRRMVELTKNNLMWTIIRETSHSMSQRETILNWTATSQFQTSIEQLTQGQISSDRLTTLEDLESQQWTIILIKEETLVIKWSKHCMIRAQAITR